MVEYDYKNVDWKAVKAKWDASPMWYIVKIQHKDVLLTFQSFLDKSKRYKLMVYINGVFKGEFLDKDHPNQKYFAKKVILPNKKLIDIERRYDKKCKKMTDKQVIEYKDMFVYHYRTPYCSNIAQIKKMVTSLE